VTVFHFTSQPLGTQVNVDGEAYSTTPCTADLPVRKVILDEGPPIVYGEADITYYVSMVRWNGFQNVVIDFYHTSVEDEPDIYIDGDMTTGVLNSSLSPAPWTLGTITVTAYPDYSHVYLDGWGIGIAGWQTANQMVLETTLDYHEVKVAESGYFDYVNTLLVGAATSITATLSSAATIYFSSYPNGTSVWVWGYSPQNGDPLGRTTFSAEIPISISGIVTAITDAGSGRVNVACSGHGLQDTNQVKIINTSSYNGYYSILRVDDNTFSIPHAFVSNESGNALIGRTVVFWLFGYNLVDGVTTALVKNFVLEASVSYIDANMVTLEVTLSTSPPGPPDLPPTGASMTRTMLVFYGTHSQSNMAKIYNIRPTYLLDNTTSGFWHTQFGLDDVTVGQLQSVGIKVIGYTACHYANRAVSESPDSDLVAEVKNMINLDGVDGVFIDEAPPNPAMRYSGTYPTGQYVTNENSTYMATLISIVHGLGKLIIFNPGLNDHSGDWYTLGADFMMGSEIFENPADDGLSVVQLAHLDKAIVLRHPYPPEEVITEDISYLTMHHAYLAGIALTYSNSVEYTQLPDWWLTLADRIRAVSNGCLWTSGSGLKFISETGVKKSIAHDGTNYATVGAMHPSFIWIETEGKLAFIDQNGVKRKTVAARDGGATSATERRAWVEGETLCFIGIDMHKYVLAGG
jgi:hypothetical protein